MTAPGVGGLAGRSLFLIVVSSHASGNLYFQLHALPERPHHATQAQMEVVAILALAFALFTHRASSGSRPCCKPSFNFAAFSANPQIRIRIRSETLVRRLARRLTRRAVEPALEEAPRR
jgi:hypothetical protein